MAWCLCGVRSSATIIWTTVVNVKSFHIRSAPTWLQNCYRVIHQVSVLFKAKNIFTKQCSSCQDGYFDMFWEFQFQFMSRISGSQFLSTNLAWQPYNGMLLTCVEFQYIGYGCMAYMDYMDPDVCCPKQIVKHIHLCGISATSSNDIDWHIFRFQFQKGWNHPFDDCSVFVAKKILRRWFYSFQRYEGNTCYIGTLLVRTCRLIRCRLVSCCSVALMPIHIIPL